MDSLDAQCLVVGLLDAGGVGPDCWRHDCDGSLHYRYAGSPRSFSWAAAAVTELAEQWRSDGPRLAPPESIARHVSAHLALMATIAGADRDPPDAVFHDLDCAEVQAIWTEQKVVMIVELDGPPVEEQLRSGPGAAG